MKNYERYPVGVDRSGISPPDDGWLVTSRNPLGSWETTRKALKYIPDQGGNHNVPENS